ncbi:hypothetical protein HDU92_002313 [Lobulomyces angularis]|nr:hypothetical protein HDU92_002313 [Lobulomyces angularis]
MDNDAKDGKSTHNAKEVTIKIDEEKNEAPTNNKLSNSAGPNSRQPSAMGNSSLQIDKIVNKLKNFTEITEEPIEEEEEIFFGALFQLDHSPAFKFLEQRRQRKELTEKRMNELKGYIKNLHSFLLNSNTFEKKLAKKVKQVQQEVANQRMEIDRCGTKTFSDNTSIGELKRELLKIENEERLAMDREAKLQKDLEESQIQKADLNSEIDEIRKHKADMLEPQLIATTKELKLDVIQRRNQVENLEKDLEEKDSTLEMCTKEKDRLEIERDKLAIAISKASEMPLKILKQCEVLRNAISSLVSENSKQTTLSLQLDKEIERLAKKKIEFEERKLDQAAEFEQRRAEIHEMEKQCDEIFKQHELAKEHLSSLKAEKVKHELQIRHLIHQMKREHDILLRSLRDKESQLKLCRKLEMTVNNIHMSTEVLENQKEETKRHVQAAKREELRLRKEITDIRKKIDLSLYSFLKQEQMEKLEFEKVHQFFTVNQKLELELEELTKTFAALEKEIMQSKAERELKSRNVIRISQKYSFIKDEIAMTDIAIFDYSKRCGEAVQRLKDFATMYDVVKNERNKYMNQIQTTMQRAAEMKEKIRILSNEIEILRHEIMNKDRELQKKKQENDAAYSQRDGCKNEANKSLSLYREKRDQIGQHLSKIDTLNMVINGAEEDMINLKQRFALAAKERNEVGMHLLDRNDELCILYEKLNIQVMTLNKGQEELNNREDERRKYEIIRMEVSREVELLKTLRPKVNVVNCKLEKCQKELTETRSRMLELSAKMESPDDRKRSRYLGGEDPKKMNLTQKIQSLEEMLAEKEEKLLEKDLILAEISTMTKRLKQQTVKGRPESNEVALQLNDLAKRIRAVTRSMMGKVSELSMHQALTLSLYQQKTEKETLIQNAKTLLNSNKNGNQNGSSVSLFKNNCWESVELEIKKNEKQKLRRELELRNLMDKKSKEIAQASGQYVDLDEDGFFILDKLKTTAEPRPNAYLPEDAGLPIPKPYGSQAPFKPSDNVMLRHYRKPVIKPIEI